MYNFKINKNYIKIKNYINEKKTINKIYQTLTTL